LKERKNIFIRIGSRLLGFYHIEEAKQQAWPMKYLFICLFFFPSQVKL